MKKLKKIDYKKLGIKVLVILALLGLILTSFMPFISVIFF